MFLERKKHSLYSHESPDFPPSFNHSFKSYEYLKSLRSKGYTRSQEVENMILGGVEKYETAVVEKAQKEEEVRIIEC